MLRGGRPKVEEERTPRTPRTPRVPRTPRSNRKKSFLMRHFWYCGWGTAGLAGLAKLYEKNPELAKRVTPMYISVWLVGAVALPPYMARRPIGSKKPSTEDEKDVVLKV